jgi:hypothetical protein
MPDRLRQGILKAINVNRLTRAGCVFKFWVADWFALLNNKMGGDLKKIRTVGKYMIEVWRAADAGLHGAATDARALRPEALAEVGVSTLTRKLLACADDPQRALF